MAATPKLTIVKHFTYRGDPNEEWSNIYHFSGGTPSNATDWKALADAVIASEKQCYTSSTHAIRAYGNVPGTNHAVWSYDYLLNAVAVAGTLTRSAGAYNMAGDQAGVLEWSTADYTSRGKRIYLRKFFHDGGTGPGGNMDNLDANTLAAYVAFGTAWVNGFITSTYKIAGPNGAAGSSPKALPYVTTRTLKRRGRRP